MREGLQALREEARQRGAIRAEIPFLTAGPLFHWRFHHWSPGRSRNRKTGGVYRGAVSGTAVFKWRPGVASCRRNPTDSTDSAIWRNGTRQASGPVLTPSRTIHGQEWPRLAFRVSK